MCLGRDGSTNNAAEFHFNYKGAGLTTNSLGIGFYGSDEKLIVSPKNVVVTNGANFRAECGFYLRNYNGISALYDDGSYLRWSGDRMYINGDKVSISDRRLKENVKELNNDDNTVIDNAKVYSFTRKFSKENRIEYGVMAQELEQLAPELVYDGVRVEGDETKALYHCLSTNANNKIEGLKNLKKN